MSCSEILNSIRELNLSYLMLAQRMLRDDRAVGMFRLGLSAQLADLLSALTPAQSIKLAASERLLCLFRLNERAMLAALAAPMKEVDLTRTHAALLLASQPAGQFA